MKSQILETKMSFAKHHDELKKLMSRHKGQEFTHGEILSLFKKEYPDLDADWVQPSDHCIDHICKGGCSCAKTDEAIFRRPGRNRYVVI